MDMSNYLTAIILCTFCMLAQSQIIINSANSPRNNVNPRAIEPIVIVHGGAGDIPDSRDMGKHRGTRIAVRLGYDKLKSGGNVLDAVEAAVRSMELDENFNCGYGSVLTFDGIVQMDASIMNGSNLDAGCVTLVEDILHPISLARGVMERTRHTFLGGEGAMRFAREENVNILHPPGQLVTPLALEALEAFKLDQQQGRDIINAKTEIGYRGPYKDFGEVGTVGAVAIDEYGNIAVATSTGGITGKITGRIGDTPIIGSGTYADNKSGGVSTTGHGETIMRYNVATRILRRIELLGESAQVATETVLKEMTERLSQTAGAITIDANGTVGMYWTSEKMSWAYRQGDTVYYGIKHGEILTEKA